MQIRMQSQILFISDHKAWRRNSFLLHCWEFYWRKVSDHWLVLSLDELVGASWVRRKVGDWLPHQSQQLYAKIILGLNDSTSKLSSKEALRSVLPVPLQQSQLLCDTSSIWAFSTLLPSASLCVCSDRLTEEQLCLLTHPTTQGSWGRREGAGKQAQTLAGTAGNRGWLWVNPEWAVRCFTDT